MGKREFVEHEPLALSYRPKFLEDLVGQEQAVSQVFGMFKSKRLSRTFLISGPRGSGKTTLARLIAKYANCSNYNEEENKPCGECRSCKTFTQNGVEGNRNVHEHNAANARGIDDVRAIITQSQFNPTDNYRVYIIDEAHMLSAQAQECFLKPLEEPSKRTIFILCTTNPEKIIGTILSRCKKINIRQVETKDSVRLMLRICKKEKMDIDKKILRQVASLTDNHPRDSLQALDSLFDMVHAGKELTGDEITKVVEQATGLPPWQLVSGFLFSIYKGSLVGAFKRLEMLENPDYFVKEVMKFHRNAMYYAMTDGKDEDLIDRTLYKFNKSFQELIDTEQIIINDRFRLAMASAMDEFVKTAGSIKEYVVDFQNLLVACVARVTPTFKAIRVDAERKKK